MPEQPSREIFDLRLLWSRKVLFVADTKSRAEVSDGGCASTVKN